MNAERISRSPRRPPLLIRLTLPSTWTKTSTNTPIIPLPLLLPPLILLPRTLLRTLFPLLLLPILITILIFILSISFPLLLSFPLLFSFLVIYPLLFSLLPIAIVIPFRNRNLPLRFDRTPTLSPTPTRTTRITTTTIIQSTRSRRIRFDPIFILESTCFRTFRDIRGETDIGSCSRSDGDG